MPAAEEAKLKKQAARRIKGKGKEAQRRRDAYVYGTLRKMGWKPSRERK